MSHRQNQHKGSSFCRYCPYVATDAPTLCKHNKEMHLNKKTRICPICKKAFFKNNTLNTHMLIHSDKKQVCDKCGATFNNKSNFLVHYRKHTGETPYACSICNKQFGHSSTMKNHELIHSNEKNHVCDVCGDSFKALCSLQSHKRHVHSDMKPYSCTVCNRAFKAKYDLKKHMFIHTGVKKYICEVCGKGFNRNANMQAHIRVMHTDEKTKVCELWVWKILSNLLTPECT